MKDITNKTSPSIIKAIILAASETFLILYKNSLIRVIASKASDTIRNTLICFFIQVLKLCIDSIEFCPFVCLKDNNQDKQEDNKYYFHADSVFKKVLN